MCSVGARVGLGLKQLEFRWLVIGSYDGPDTEALSTKR
jgi:hypothetical protein